jgi:hypothetical protein
MSGGKARRASGRALSRRFVMRGGTRLATTTIDFAGISAAALRCSELIVRRWLPAGRREGREWVARNPRRVDKWAGSFKVNLAAGRWSDFATGDLISLAAHRPSISQGEAALAGGRQSGLGCPRPTPTILRSSVTRDFSRTARTRSVRTTQKVMDHG